MQMPTVGWPDRNPRETAVQDADHVAGPDDLVTVYTALTAARMVTLPVLATVPNGRELLIADGAGHAAAHHITVAAAPGETISGAATVVISVDFGVVRLLKTSVGWLAV